MKDEVKLPSPTCTLVDQRSKNETPYWNEESVRSAIEDDRLKRGVPAVQMTKDELESCITAIENGLTPNAKMFIPKGWNVILSKLQALKEVNPKPAATEKGPSDGAVARVTAFLDRRESIRNIDPEVVMALDGIEHELRVGDLRYLLARYGSAQPAASEEPIAFTTLKYLKRMTEAIEPCAVKMWPPSMKAPGEVPLYGKLVAAQPSVQRYTSDIGLAGQAYIDSLKSAHQLPAQFRWADLWMNMCKAASGEPSGGLYPTWGDGSIKGTLSEEITSNEPIDHEEGQYGDEARYIITAAQVDRLDSIERISKDRDAQPAVRAVPIELQGIADALEDGDGVWRSCTGCHELNEGRDTGLYSKTLKCHLGNGCSECGGIGAIWDTTNYQAMADDMARDMAAPVAAQTRNNMPASIGITLELERWRNALIGLCDTDRINTPEQAVSNIKGRMGRRIGMIATSPHQQKSTSAKLDPSTPTET